MTMYSNQLAVAIKSAGKVLREQKDKVFLPFGSEYSIYIKNLNTVRALVRIELDGQSVTGNTDLVVQPNDSIDLERFMKTGNLNEGNRFKFIERSGKVEAHRGVQAEDGLLRVEFQFEKPSVDWKQVFEEAKKKEVHHYHHYDYYRYPYWHRPYWYYDGPYYGGCYGIIGGNLGSAGNNLCDSGVTENFMSTSGSVGSAGQATYTSTTVATDSPLRGIVSNSMSVGGNAGGVINTAFLNNISQNVAQEVNDAGITVPGSLSDQKFSMVASFPVEDEKHVIILKLLGETGKGKIVKQAVTVKHSQVCSTCGTRNRGKLAQFCRECGTSLDVTQ